MSLRDHISSVDLRSSLLRMPARARCAIRSVGPGVLFRWLRVKFLETGSSPRPSYFREISGKAVLCSMPQLKKWCVEYVILAGSLLFSLSGAQSRYGPGLASAWRRTMRDFFNDFDFFAPEIANFCSPAGASLGSEGSRGVLRGKSTREGLDFLPKGVKFPGKFPEMCFSRGSNFQRNF